MSGDYFQFFNNKLSQATAERHCNEYGRHLASINSVSKMEKVTQRSQCDYIWIGLETRKKTLSPIEYYWTDNTKAELPFIYQNWCDEYPIPYTPNSTIFIDKIANCWKSTTNSSFQTCSVCGPETFDTTNGLYAVSYIVIPALFSLVAIIYSLCVCKKLKKRLYKNKTAENWVIIPTKSIKRTSMSASFVMTAFFLCTIIHSIVLYSAYNSTGILSPTSLIDNEYPPIYKVAGIIRIVICIIYVIYMPIIYVHLLLRLKHSFNNNPVFRTGIPSKCAYRAMISLITIYLVIPMVYVVLNGYLEEFNDVIKPVVVFSWITVDIAINILLLQLYFKAMYKFKEYSYKYNTIMNQDQNSCTIDYEIQSQHEIMIEFRRYTVLFVILCFINILITIMVTTAMVITMKYQQNTQHERYLKHLVTIIVLYLKTITILQIIYLSFNFSHLKYKKYCKCCDKLMENKCNKIVAHRNKEIELPQLTTIESDMNNNENHANDKETTNIVKYSRVSTEADNHNRVGITFDDYLQHGEEETESHANIAKMQNAEDNVDALNFIVTE